MTANAVATRHDHPIDFRPDVEGLRAVAVLSVVLHHLGVRWLPGGYIGVDIFFVISGYLISLLLLRRLARREFSVADFYAARIRRIFPALFVVLVVSTVVGFYALPPADTAAFGRTVRSTAWFYSNFELNGQTGYFDGAAELKPLLHTWSLAVEEQFYLVYPLVLALLMTQQRRVLPLLLVAALALSLALSGHWAGRYPSLGFYSALSRAHELLIGATIAVLDPRLASRKLAAGLGLAGAARIAVPLLIYDDGTPFPGYLAILPCLGAGLLVIAGQDRQGSTHRLLSLAPVRFDGAISYSLYLWHWPVLVFWRHLVQRDPAPLEQAGLLATMLALSALCWRFIERPARATRLRTRSLLALGLVVMVGATAAGWWLESGKGLEWRFGPMARAYFAAAHDSNPRRRECHASDANAIDYASKCVFGDSADRRGPLVAVWADSHGAELAYALGQIAGGNHRAVAEVTYSTCPPSIGFRPAKIVGCADHNERTLEALFTDANVGTVVVAAHYEHYLRHDDGPAFLAGLAKTASLLQAAGKRVVLVAPVPTYEYPVPQALGMRAFRGQDPLAFGQALAQHRQRAEAAAVAIDSIARQYGVTVVDPASVLCSGGQCITSDHLRVLYFDSHHLSLAGAERVARVVAAQLGWDPDGPELSHLHE